MKQLLAVLYNNGMVDDLLQVPGKNIDDNLHWFRNCLFSVRLFYWEERLSPEKKLPICQINRFGKKYAKCHFQQITESKFPTSS